MDNSVKEKLLKIKALADKGSDGERENAQRALDRLLSKYEVTFDELLEIEESGITNFYEFRASEWYYKQLLVNIIYMVLTNDGVAQEDVHVYHMRRKRRVMEVECTESQSIEITLEFEYRKQELDSMISNFVLAYLFKNHIESKGPKKSSGELSKEEIARYLEINKFETMINPTSRHTLKLEEYKGEDNE